MRNSYIAETRELKEYLKLLVAGIKKAAIPYNADRFGGVRSERKRRIKVMSKKILSSIIFGNSREQIVRYVVYDYRSPYRTSMHVVEARNYKGDSEWVYRGGADTRYIV